MKKNILFVAITAFVIGLNSCSSPGEKLADDLCNCVLENTEEDDMMDKYEEIGDDGEVMEDVMDCALDRIKEAGEEMKEMDRDDRVDFVRDFITAFFETECYKGVKEEVIKEFDDVIEDLDIPDIEDLIEDVIAGKYNNPEKIMEEFYGGNKKERSYRKERRSDRYKDYKEEEKKEEYKTDDYY